MSPDRILRLASIYLVQKQAAWAGSGFGGTLTPPEVTLQPGAGAKHKEPLHGWDRYIELVATSYHKAPMESGAGHNSFIALKQHILQMFARIQSKIKIEFVDYEPYSSAEDMKTQVAATGVLEISSQFNQSAAFGPEVNLMLRAVHDFTAHLGSNPKNKARSFSFKGELQSFNKHQALVGSQSKAVGALFTEIVGQASHYWYYGGFPQQKIIVMSEFPTDKLGAVQGYRIVNGDLV